MKETMRGLPSFLTFDTPVDLEYIRCSFTDQQGRYQLFIPEWDAPSTRRILVNRYWYTHVPNHFAVTIGLPILLLWPVVGRFDVGYWLVSIAVALLGFLTLMIAAYLPGFRSKFLPHLDAVVSGHKNRQQEKIIQQLREQLAQQQVRSETLQQQSEVRLQEKLSEQQSYLTGQQAATIRQLREELAEQQMHLETLQQQSHTRLQEKLSEQQVYLADQQLAMQHNFEQKLTAEKKKVERLMAAQEKCREAQLPNFSLALIYYVFTQITSNNGIACTDDTARQMGTLFGVDPGSLRNHIELIAGNGSKRKQLGQKKSTGLRYRFEEVIQFFESLQCPQAVTIVKELECKILGS